MNQKRFDVFYYNSVGRSCKRIKDGTKKTRIPLDSSFILEVTCFLWCLYFLEPVEVVGLPKLGI